MNSTVMRYVSGIIAAFILLACLWLGKDAVLVASVIICFIALYEYQETVGIQNPLVNYIGGALIFLAWYYGIELPLVFFAVLLVQFMLVLLKKSELLDVGYSLLGLTYIVLPLVWGNAIMQTRGQWYLLLAVLIPVTTDTFAYLIGKTFGKTKLLPSISPKKTVEGSIGGTVVSTICTVTYCYFMLPSLFPFSGILGLSGSLISQVGDLSASSIKRKFQVKDFGNIMPGHGGILDRFDSILVVLPLVYFVMRFS